jgi:PhzF family phenazine biosynthesis protein
MSIRYQLLDVFTRAQPSPLSGNPLAVFQLDQSTDARLRDPTVQQQIANWLNLSETTFAYINADRASYSLRIYTPRQELPFAGHPTIGSYAALFDQLIAEASHAQHCAAGVLPLRADGEADAERLYWVQTPAATLRDMSAHSQVLQDALGLRADQSRTELKIANVNNGPTWTVLQLQSAAEVLALRPNFAELKRCNIAMRSIGAAIFAWGEDEDGSYIESRCFVPIDNIEEDPVTGSANAAIAAFLYQKQPRSFHYRARQGRAMGRDGELFLRIEQQADGAQIFLGGRARKIALGAFSLP